MSGWKSGVLSLAGRVTLVQFVTSTISSYTMQTFKISKNICERMDKINIVFFVGTYWG